eukprot:CAMPEP_0205820550 /NCGR_PEP_ID=MMETSP0206-20130828/3206_1 /ASSEMBLY_ACC=CAM_ASM_000279 /TAXON_ID=36767 /ORGANISM="Euplotes focardii, Strain TN1" /LENGTH=161 /DNA_ID=CAMNT_0053115381 /DNA_START=27 /DNA_END=508 /DNA_ORIENTATION=+
MDAFFGFELVAGKEEKPKIPGDSVLRVSQLALPAGATERITIYVTVDGKTFAIATLDPKANVYHNVVDLIFSASQGFAMSAKGKGSVHVTGYLQATGDDDFGEEDGDLAGEGSDDSDDDAMMAAMEDEEESESEEEAAPAKSSPKQAAKPASPKQSAKLAA